MNGMSTFLSIPRLSKTRKRFALGYLLFILLLITPIYIPWSKLPETATGAWNDFERWLGPAPTGLEMRQTHNEEEHSTLYLFTFAPAPEQESLFIQNFGLKPTSEPLPTEWQMEPAPGTGLYRPEARRNCMMAGNCEWGYVIDDLVFTRLSNGRSLLAFRQMHGVPDTSASVGRHYSPHYEEKDAPLLLIIISLLFIPYMLCWFMLVPLGFLLLFPSFTLQSTLHRVIWYAAIFVPQLLLFIWAHLVIHDPAIIGADITFVIGTPLMLLGARSLLPLALRFIHAAQKSD